MTTDSTISVQAEQSSPSGKKGTKKRIRKESLPA